LSHNQIGNDDCCGGDDDDDDDFDDNDNDDEEYGGVDIKEFIVWGLGEPCKTPHSLS